MTRYGREKLTDRFLPERAYLLLVYPERGKGRNTKGIHSNKKIKIPFYENPIIIENKTSRLATYKILGRNSDLFSFLGADSRSITIDTSFTLPHLFQFMKSGPWTSKDLMFDQVPKFTFLRRDIRNILSSEGSYTQDQLDEKSTALARKGVQSEVDAAINGYYGQDALRIKDSMKIFESQYNELLTNDSGISKEEVSLALGGSRASGGGPLDLPKDIRANLIPSFEGSSDARQVKAAYLYYINLLRSCVLGSEELGLGPPIIRLNYGPLYQDVPCIVTQYNLEADQAAGYDIETLLPRKITMNLSLLEIRVGDFSAHSPEKFGLPDDNVPTWESVLKYGTVDPRSEPRLTNPSTMDQYRNAKESDRQTLARRSRR